MRVRGGDRLILGVEWGVGNWMEVILVFFFLLFSLDFALLLPLLSLLLSHHYYVSRSRAYDNQEHIRRNSEVGGHIKNGHVTGRRGGTDGHAMRRKDQTYEGKDEQKMEAKDKR